jgi:hypothetical protein
MTDKLKSMVEKATKKIWAIHSLFPGEGEGYLTIKGWHADSEKLHVRYQNGRDNIMWAHFSISDLLFNHEFMKALLGERFVNDDNFSHAEIARSIPCYLNAINTIAQLPTDEQRIDYVYNLIKGESN